MNNFQTILVAVFLAFFAFGVLIFSGLIKIGGSSNNGEAQGKITIWGTFPGSAFSESLDLLNSANRELTVKYTSKDTSTYQQDLIEAFANGEGPDLFVISPDMIKKNNNFIYKIPYESYPEKSFKETFIDGGDIYLDKEGIVGLPLIVDPLVLYYNKDILSNEGIASPLQTWDELFGINQTLTKRDNSGTISQSMIALGQYQNINNVKDILASLLIQNNNMLVERVDDTSNNNMIAYNSTLDDNHSGYSVSPIESVLKFFIEFSNPSNSAYSWNRSLSNSLDMFTGGKLAFYIGRASELFNIEEINPNLSFDVTQIPQVKDSSSKRTYGEIYAIAVNKKSTNITSAFSTAFTLSGGENAKALSVSLSLPPTTRALLADKPKDNPYLFTYFNSALISRSWLDPDKNITNSIFQEMVESILSNNLSVGEAVGKAQGKLDLLLK